MRILNIVSTVREVIFGNYRVLRGDDDGYLQVVTPAGASADVNVAEVGGNTVEDGGINGSLAVGGASAVGVAPTSDPVPAGIVDSGGLTRIPVGSGDDYIGVAGKDTGGGNPISIMVDGDGRLVLAAEDSIGDPYPLIVHTASSNLQVGGDVEHDAAKTTSPPNKQGGVARSSLPTAVTADDDIVEKILDRYGRDISAAFEFLSESERQTRQNPSWSQKDGDPVVDVTNGVSAVAPGDVDYTYYFSPEDFGSLYLAWRLNGGAGGGGITMTIEMTARDDGTAKDSIPATDWDDITNDLVGAATITAAAGADTDDYVVDVNSVVALAKWIRINVNVDATTGTADWTIWKRQGVL